jgi:glycosyltransferase involved in cell wall biosynthesis
MPCFNEAGYIEACLRSVQAQDYAADRIEVLVADGMSSDGTRDILARLAAEDGRIRVIDNPDRFQAPGMNAAIVASRGDVIMRMDVHAEYARDYVRQCVRVLEVSGADNVGGAQRARADTDFRRALCAALDSPLAVGGARYRNADNEGFVDTVFLGTFRRAVFERVGLYDPKAITNEDAEVNQRIGNAGGKVYLSRDIIVHYYPRGSIRSLAKQYYKYGFGRARTTLKHGGVPRLRPVVPFLMVLFGLATLALSLREPRLLAVFPLYALATCVEALRVGRRAGVLWAAPLIWLIFPVLHLSHGVGFAAGLARYLRHPDWSEPARLAPRVAEEKRVA